MDELNAKEFWKPVVGYEGLYEVSNLGKVRSLPRATIIKSHIVKIEIGRNGRRRATLTNG